MTKMPSLSNSLKYIFWLCLCSSYSRLQMYSNACIYAYFKLIPSQALCIQQQVNRYNNQTKAKQVFNHDRDYWKDTPAMSLELSIFFLSSQMTWNYLEWNISVRQLSGRQVDDELFNRRLIHDSIYFSSLLLIECPRPGYDCRYTNDDLRMVHWIFLMHLSRFWVLIWVYLEFTGNTRFFEKRKSSLTSFKEYHSVISAMRPQDWCLAYCKIWRFRNTKNSDKRSMFISNTSDEPS